MKNTLKLISLILTLVQLSGATRANAQIIDTLVDVSDYKLHFHIIKGRGIPILFEAGGGETAAVWKNILPDIARITGTTLISYDRTGFGSSTFNSQRHGILNGIIGLETALHKLGYDQTMLLVAHSQGGIYAQLYAYRHPQQIKGAVLIDISSSCWFAGKRLVALQHESDLEKQKHKVTKPGLYYLFDGLTANFDYIRNKPFPTSFPIIDFVAERPFTDSMDVLDWHTCHAAFVKQSPNRMAIMARGCGHYIYKDNPPLVVSAIAKMYAQTLTPQLRVLVMDKAHSYMMNALNKPIK
ncbi:alpha/beta hydrolase [Spirosoma pollinicola]|uniref:AB hydrolase-1 domain-containing protein n=1 Tax=Spirosoma pollinicola TaxID=2057025 RepID=A0A2K8YUY9_9BACT|nr:alpha/beta hydrolase [Spirosoma pollinicola]AUD01436.1 hypothetical protein CWM47_06195 [Spirosoma pollinicola]